MLRIGVVATLAAAIAAPVAAERSQAPTQEIVVTRDSPTLPAGCSPRQVATLLVRFTDAFNRGDRKALARFFPNEDPAGRVASEPAGTVFRWYSVSEGTARHVALFDLPDLFRYFEQRHRRGETLRLISVDVGTMDWLPQTAGAGLMLRREADDIPAGLGPYAHGKAAIDCRRQRIFVWSIGQDDSREPRFLCPRPADWTPSGPALACTRTGTAPTAQELAPQFVVGATSVTLPKRCRPSAVRARVESMLRSFNLGDADRFARGFTSRGQFHPYTASIHGSGFIGRPKIAAFVRKRYAAGDGWTAIALHPPANFFGDRAIYQLVLRVVNVGEGGAKLVIDCRSGLLSAWVGPGVSQPG